MVGDTRFSRPPEVCRGILDRRARDEAMEHGSPTIRPKRMHADMIDDDTFSIASPMKLKDLADVKSPCIRPIAPSVSFYRSPPPPVSGRLARSYRRGREETNVEASKGLQFCDLAEVAGTDILSASALITLML